MGSLKSLRTQMIQTGVPDGRCGVAEFVGFVRLNFGVLCSDHFGMGMVTLCHCMLQVHNLFCY